MSVFPATGQLSLYAQIQREIRQYLHGFTSLAAFHAWFSDVAWSVEEVEDKLAEELVYDVTLAISEFQTGHWNEDDLADRLNQLSHNHRDLQIRTFTGDNQQTLTGGGVTAATG